MKKSYLKKYLLLILSFVLTASLCLSVGCSRKTTETEPESGSASFMEEITRHDNNSEKVAAVDTESSNSLFNFSLYENDTPYSKEDLAVQQNFEKYLNDLFTYEYSMNSISMNFLIECPENYGISRISSTWPETDLSGMEEYFTNISRFFDELNTFHYDSLTCEQQLIYDTLKTYLETETTFKNCWMFVSPFSTNGIPSQLPLIFTEYTFNDRQDIEDYIGLLETLQNYVKNALEYEETRMDQGYYLSQYSYETALNQCEAFLDQGDDYLTEIFKNKLEPLEYLTEQEKEMYINRNSDAIKNSVIPSYNLMIDTLSEFEKNGQFNKGLCQMEHGREYYNYILKNNTGTDKTPEELISIVEQNITEYRAQMTSLITLDTSLYEKMENPEYIYSDPDEILSYFIKMLKTDFPKPASDNYSLKETDAAMSDALIVAFYILSPIDNFQNNIIYVNPNKTAQANSLFPTLAHEGLPGHMYQHDYFCSLKPHYFRSLLSFTGYSEAWAKYVELYSYDWSGLDTNLSELLRLNDLFSIALPTRLDLGINYEGWTLHDTEAYLSGLGIDDKETAKLYYNITVSSPAVFLPYYVGYLELEDLKASARNALGDNFNIKDFHKFYLEIGPSYFNIIRERMDTWIEKINNR